MTMQSRITTLEKNRDDLDGGSIMVSPKSKEGMSVSVLSQSSSSAPIFFLETRTPATSRLQCLFMLLLCSCWMLPQTDGFTCSAIMTAHLPLHNAPPSDRARYHLLSSSALFNLLQDDGDDDKDESPTSTSTILFSDFSEEDLQPAGMVIDELNWRVDQKRLEEANTRRFLKARPRFLPYDDGCKWVQAWGNRWETKEEWRDWIMMGEKRNSYIPSDPEEYYTRTGDWISWDHFLLGVEKKDDRTP